MLVTTFGSNVNASRIWGVGVTEDSLHLTRFTATGSSTIRPQGWTPQTGWFVFAENESRIWAYNGDRELILNTETVHEKGSIGAIMSQRYPCPVPTEVLSRLSEAKRKQIETSQSQAGCR